MSTNKLHIAHVFNGVVPPMHYGGIERMVFWLARYFVQNGHQVSLVSAYNADAITVLKDNGIKWIEYPNNIAKLKNLIPNVDIIHFHSCLPQNYHPHAAFVVTEHGNHRKRIPISPNTIFISKSHAHNHCAEFYIYNGICKDEYPLQYDKQSDMLFMAALAWKNKNAVTALNLAIDSNTKINICGGDVWQTKNIRGYWYKNKKLAKQLVENCKSVAGYQKLKLLQESGLLFYIVNWQEPFALAPHEALATGTPVLASPNGALPEYIIDGENGFLVSSYKQAITAIKLYKEMNSADKHKMYLCAHQSAYSIETSAEQYLQAYNTVMKNGFLYPSCDLKRMRYKPNKSIKIKRPIWL